MSSVAQIKQMLANGDFNSQLQTVYCTDESGVAFQVERYLKAISSFEEFFGDKVNSETEINLFSAPGRTEVGGNHTDHQHGCVLAASVNLDVIAVVAKTNDSTIVVKSEGFDADVVDSSDLSIHENEKAKSSSLIRGTCKAFENKNLKFGGFLAYTTSNVLKGSGLSSSAAFEVLVGTIVNHLYNDGIVDAVAIAQYAQYAENVYFDKPCGLMDQTASSVGSFVSIDFNDTDKPIVKKVNFDFAHSGHNLVIVDTKGDHADLTPDYSAIRVEMCNVAKEFGKEYLREVNEDEFMSKLADVRKNTGDRAVLRAMHFFSDNKTAIAEAKALEENNFDLFKHLILSSGNSSYKLLQNTYSVKNPAMQGVGLGLAVTQNFLGHSGAWRVHGGGFAGTMQAFVPVEMTAKYKETVEKLFGEGSCYILSVRPVGAIKLA